jgi:hypothetical protein
MEQLAHFAIAAHGPDGRAMRWAMSAQLLAHRQLSTLLALGRCAVHDDA